MTFGGAYHPGRKFAWRLLGQTVLVGLIMLVFLLCLAAIIFSPYLLTGKSDNLIFSVFIFFIFLLPLIIASVFLNIWLRLSSRALVLNDTRIMTSLHDGKKLFRMQIGKTLLTWLIEVGLSIAVSFAFMIAVFLLALVLLGIGLLIYALLKTTGVIVFAIIAGILLFAIMLAFSSVLNTYFSTYWTLSYRALSYINSRKK